jgi:hypothetical protein
MNDAEYYREQASYYRMLAASAENDAAEQEYFELAATCEEAANNFDDCQASG